MHIQVLKENLAKTIQLAAKFASARVQLPILSHLAIEAGSEGIFVTATSLEMGVKLRLPGKILEQGVVAVPAKLMAELVQSLPLGGVDVEGTYGEGVAVVAGRTKTKLQAMNGQDFPPFPVMSEAVGVVGLMDMEKAMAKVLFAVSTDEARPVLSGLLWRNKVGELVATDGYRLSLVRDEKLLKNELMGGDFLLLPGKPMMQLVQAAREVGVKELEIGIVEQSQQLMVRGVDFWGCLRLVGGDFPKYEAIIPTDSELEFKCDREQLLTAVKTAALFARDGANIIRFVVADAVLKVSANTVQVGEHEEEIEILQAKGGSGSIAFNAKYVLDFLSRSEAREVEVKMIDSLKPGLFGEVGNENYRYVIMPVRVRE